MRKYKCPIAGMHCPRNNDPERGVWCPAWTEYSETNQQTGEDRLQRECMFTAMPKFMIHTLQAANRPAAAVESTRNEIVRGFERLATDMARLPHAVKQLTRDE